MATEIPLAQLATPEVIADAVAKIDAIQPNIDATIAWGMHAEAKSIEVTADAAAAAGSASVATTKAAEAKAAADSVPTPAQLSSTIADAVAPKANAADVYSKTAADQAIAGRTPVGAADAPAQRVDVIRRGKLGVLGTGGRTPIAIRIDHQLDQFLAKVQPVLTARALPWGIGIVTKSVGNPAALYEPTTTTWAQVKSAVVQPGGELWAHSQTHSNGDPGKQRQYRRRRAGPFPDEPGRHHRR